MKKEELKTVWVKARVGDADPQGPFWLKHGEKRFHLSQGLADLIPAALEAGHTVSLTPVKE